MTRIDNVEMGMTWTSFGAALYGALKAAGLYGKDLVWMMGETGLAFHFIVEKSSCASGPTVYDWQNRHFEMADRIGVVTRIFVQHGDPRFNSLEYNRVLQADEVKRSIDAGFPVITWAPTPILEFGLIYGYDEGDRVFLVKACGEAESEPLLFDNLGKSRVPILYTQNCIAAVEYDGEKSLRNSLNFALEHWSSPGTQADSYASGKKAWEYLLSALETRELDAFGLTYTMNLYADSKRIMARFLKEASECYGAFKGLADIQESLEVTASEMEKVAALLPFRGPGEGSLSDENIPVIREHILRAYEAESVSMKHIGELLKA